MQCQLYDQRLHGELRHDGTLGVRREGRNCIDLSLNVIERFREIGLAIDFYRHVAATLRCRSADFVDALYAINTFLYSGADP